MNQLTPPHISLLIFTDLDGSLMEHETYSIRPALAALAELDKRQIPLIINSSKTAAEIRTIRSNHNLHGAYVCENGAALYGDDDSLIASFGTPRAEWLAAIHRLRTTRSFNFVGFSDWSPKQIADLTSLSLEQAREAALRQFSEPILWRDSETAKGEFIDTLKPLGLQLLEGGRFLSIQSQFNKSDAMGWFRDEPSAITANRLFIALGDSPNDAAMLDHADIAVIIKSAKSNQISCTNALQIIRTKKPGPSGWQEAVLQLLAMLDSNQLSQLKQR